MEIIDELHSKAAWLEAIEGMTFFGIPVSEMNEEGLRQLVGFLVTEKRIMGFQPSYWRRELQPKPALTEEEKEAISIAVGFIEAKASPDGIAPIITATLRALRSRSE